MRVCFSIWAVSVQWRTFNGTSRSLMYKLWTSKLAVQEPSFKQFEPLLHWQTLRWFCSVHVWNFQTWSSRASLMFWENFWTASCILFGTHWVPLSDYAPYAVTGISHSRVLDFGNQSSVVILMAKPPLCRFITWMLWWQTVFFSTRKANQRLWSPNDALWVFAHLIGWDLQLSHWANRWTQFTKRSLPYCELHIVNCTVWTLNDKAQSIDFSFLAVFRFVKGDCIRSKNRLESRSAII